MILGIGVDVCEIARVREAIGRHGDRFTKRICTLTELQLAAELVDAAAFYAGRFAAKEAMVKALGTGITDRVRRHDIEVLNGNAGQPVVQLSGGALRRARWLADRDTHGVHLSIAYRGECAHAMVLIEAILPL